MLLDPELDRLVDLDRLDVVDDGLDVVGVELVGADERLGAL